MTVPRIALGVASLAAASMMAISACSSNVTGSDTRAADTTSAGSTSISSPTTPTSKQKPMPTSSAVNVPADVVGNGCADYARAVPDGPGSLQGMRRDPVAVAVSNSAELTTLAGALSGRLNTEVDLTETLSKGQYTVFAPTDDAFGKLAPEVVDKFRNDPAELTAVLKYHVIPSELDEQAVEGEQTTLQGQTLSVTGAGDSLRVNGAGVLCGGIKTANAIVYLIDTVLMPPPPAPTTTPTTSTTDSTETTATPTP